MKKSKLKTTYVCNECGATFPTWVGRCSVCGSYNSVVEEIVEEKKAIKSFTLREILPKPITNLKSDISLERIKSGFDSLDKALGGGFVSGQVVLVSGEPGIGKSTLLLQVASNFAKRNKTLYISAEESSHQVYLRAQRLSALNDNLYVLSDTNLENIISGIENLKPGLIVLDSVQTVYSENLESPAGSVSQVKYVSSKITEISKSKGIISLIVGQVTKEGTIAGPKVLEHLVDTVAQFEGERGYAYRILKVIKNRFGSSGEIAVFNMTDKGMEEVLDPSGFFISEKPANQSGSVIFPYTEGSKPILVEVQALVSKTFYPVPQRRSQGIDLNKISIITAIMENQLKINLKDKDIFVNVVGGIKIDEPAVDLAVATAIFSAYKNIPVPDDMAIFGELGLTGEVRSVHFEDIRIKECKSKGITKILASTKYKDDSLTVLNIQKINQILDIIK
ncbi:DNA repair protein RadA [Sulfurihydrogenibium sp.]|uniref:DNA repair protein RadA n=1 Tax=Sulfurihydrogenibium sp. TaxID=2053621 RepID=UPI0026398BD4|nr:DNA repair protein RadA [Sulfurihydrogenibium sp.]